MTDRTWTSEEIQTEFEGCQTVGDLVVKLEMIAAQTGEVVCEIRLNGQVIEEEIDQQIAVESIQKIQNVTMRSDRPEALISQALRSASHFIPLLSLASEEAAGLFRDGDLRLANEKFREVLEGCQWFVDTLHHARGAASGIGAPIANVERWHAAETLLFGVVSELTETFGRKDYIAAADTLEFELAGALESWKPLLDEEGPRRST